ncbi:MAG: hypothetical protein WCX65_09500 [bacterium]
MRKLSLLIVAAAAAIIVLPGAAHASKAKSGFPTPGERAQAMGNAFVAVANDTNAIFWNPAGMALIKDRQAQISHTDLYGLGIDYNYLAYAQESYGLAWAHIDSGSFLLGSDRGSGSSGGDFSQDMYIVSYARKMDPQTYAGASIKWNQQKYAPPSTLQAINGNGGTPLSMGLTGDGFSIDVGVLYKVDEATTLGGTIKDLFGEFKTKGSTGSTSADRYDPSISIGFARQANKDTLYTVQLSELGKESTVHFGIEKKIQPEFILRGGVDDEVITAGIGFVRNEWEINYSYKNKTAAGLEQTQRFGAIVHF